MQLTLFTDYALRVLIFTANKPSGELATMREISEFYKISPDHLRKVNHKLSQAGFICSYRGKNGGIKLAHDAKKILLGEVIKIMEGGGELVDCEGRKCLYCGGCSLRETFNKGLSAFYNELNKFTLEDVAQDKRMKNPIRKLLSIK